MQVFLVRHGQTQWNVEGLLQGSSDIPLTALGRRQAESAAAALVGRVGDHPIIVASPLERARHTAHALADRLRVDVVVDDRLRERAYGVWEGVTPEERQRRWPDEVALWHAHGDPMLPGFEEHSAVQSRMIAGIEDWTDKAEEQGCTLVAFAHGSCIRVGLHGLLDLPLTHRTLGNLGNTAWSQLARRERGDWTLDRHNVTAETVAIA